MSERLDALAALVAADLDGDGTVEIHDVHHDSRSVTDGSLFVAIRGFAQDGHAFIGDAIAAGAAAIVVEKAGSGVGVPQLVVADTRRSIGPLAAAVHGHPSRELDIVGVTGTNGKTTVTRMIDAVAGQAGIPSAVIGTLGVSVMGEAEPIARTTPEAGDLQRLLRRLVERGVRLVAMEVSSHALTLGRVDGTDFTVTAFTNLSQDHLDFH
ncbi:MAG: Mur ligase family protein, partial [Acidimicrobiia bacterium]|nr:Mur ligase family protein [Acidimicrobiia bacterium]